MKMELNILVRRFTETLGICLIIGALSTMSYSLISPGYAEGSVLPPLVVVLFCSPTRYDTLKLPMK